jgi:hypothetical protein
MTDALVKKFVAVSILFTLVGCGGNSNVGRLMQGGSSPAQATGASSTLSASIPEPFNAYVAAKGGACGFEKAVNPAAERVGIAGWAVVDSKRGVLPEQVILKVEAGGKTQYILPRRTQRDDVAAFFKKPNLAGSGFVQVVPIAKADRPATVTALLAFNKKLMTCAGRVEVKSS